MLAISSPSDPSADRLTNGIQSASRQISGNFLNEGMAQKSSTSSSEQNHELVLANFIDGAFRPPHNNHYLDNFNPSTGSVYGKVPDSDSVDIKDAVESARRAFPEWSQTSRQKRSEILTKIADLLDQNSKGKLYYYDTEGITDL